MSGEIVTFIGIGVIGELVMYLVRKFPFVRMVKYRYVKELIDCDLCLGVWVYFGLCIYFGTNIFSGGIGYFISGMILSFIMYLVKTGWFVTFGEIRI